MFSPGRVPPPDPAAGKPKRSPDGFSCLEGRFSLVSVAWNALALAGGVGIAVGRLSILGRGGLVSEVRSAGKKNKKQSPKSAK
eukprot:1370430-Amorphochlora_amoeboformis.AAC.1